MALVWISGDPGFADPHRLGDLFHIQVFLVIQGKHHLLVFPRGPDALGQHVLQLLLLDHLVGLLGGFRARAGRQQSRTWAWVSSRASREITLRREMSTRSAWYLLFRHTQALGHLSIGGEPAQGAVQLPGGLVESPGPCAARCGASQSCRRAKSMTMPRMRFVSRRFIKFDAFVRVVFVHGVPGRRQDALVDHIVQLGKAAVDPPDLQGDPFDQLLVPQHQGPFELPARRVSL